MKVLVFGAGVIGTLYAARLAEHGHEVTVLARGRRLADIRQCGLVLEDIVNRHVSTTPVATIETLGPKEVYDVVLVAVRREQLASVTAALQVNRVVPTFLFMLNNPIGVSELAKQFGVERVLLGFPGAGGALEDSTVRYAMIAQQPTTLGEVNGRRSPRVRALAAEFQAAGFNTKVSSDMDAWLKTHAFFVTAVSGAIYLSGGDCRRLSDDRALLTLMVRGVREGFAAIRALGLRVTPFSLRVLFTWLPPAFAVAYWKRFLSAGMADYIFGRHARSASVEMQAVAHDCRTLLEQSGGEAPALRELYNGIAAYRRQT